MINKNKLLMLIVLMCFMVFVTGCYFYPKEETMLEPPLVEDEEADYNSIPVVRKDIENRINVTGYFVSIKQYDLSFEKRGGYIESISVKSGDNVKKGDILALLDNENLLNDIKRQQIMYDNALKAYELLEKSHNNDLELANLNLDTLKKDLDMAKKIGSYSKVEIENKENEVKKQEININKIIESYEKEALSKKQNVDLEKLTFENLKLDLDKSSIKSPADGVVNYIADYKIGDYIQSRKVLISVAEESSLQLQYEGKKADQFIKGMNVTIIIDNVEYEGKVVMTPKDIPSDEKNNLKNAVRISIEEIPQNVKEGSSAKLSLVLAKSENTLVIPKAAVQGFAGRKVVKVLEEGTVYEKDIETGVESITEYEVLNGLSEGEQIIK